MKKIIVIAMVTVLAFGLTGCIKKKEEITKTEKVTKTGETKTAMGVLEAFSSGTVIIKSDDKNDLELAFEVKDATLECENMLVGDEIVVLYKGEIDGTDTSKAMVEKIIDTEKATKDKEVKESTTTGIAVDVTMNTIEIKTNEGQLYKFSTVGAEQLYKNGILIGNWVTITYVGELRGTDTSGVKVVKVRDDDPNIVEEQEKMSIKAVDETVYTTASVHIRKSYTMDSDVIVTIAQGTAIERTGVCDNGWSRIVYNGADAFIYGEYLTTTAPPQPVAEQPAAPQPATEQPATEQPVAQEPTTEQPIAQEPTTEQPAAQESEKKELVGIVEDVSMGVMTVLVKDEAITLATGDAEHSYKNGIQRGNEVSITYTGALIGTDTSNVVVLSVTDTNENSTPTITGTIETATMNTVTVTTEDGIDITFSLENVQINTADGIVNGEKVVVTLDLDEEITSSNIFPAQQIDAAK